MSNSGEKQSGIVRKLTEQFGRPFDQSRVSKFIKAVRDWYTGGNPTPPPRPTTPKTVAMDPRALDLGKNPRRR